MTASQGTLLVVDDDAMNRDMLSRRLARHGYTVEVAEDGEQALKMIEGQKFDLVLLDIMMPGVSGLQVLEILRQRHSMAELPVIMATAKDESSDIVEALKLGANDYVTKPLDFPVVLARTESQLALKRAREEIHRLAEELEKRNALLHQVLTRYVSDEVATEILANPEERLRLGGETRLVSVLFTDIRGFTAFSKAKDARLVIQALNKVYDCIVPIIFEERGTFDKYLGDGLMAFYGAPISSEDDALRAVRTAVKMRAAMHELLEKEATLRPLGLGTGIFTGYAVVGNLGTEKVMDYTCIGDTPNSARRLQEHAEADQIFISSVTYEAVLEHVNAVPTELLLEGMKAPIVAYEVVALK